MGVSRDCIPATARDATVPALNRGRQAPARSGTTEATGAFQRRQEEQISRRSSNGGSEAQSASDHSRPTKGAAGAARSLPARRGASTKSYVLGRRYGNKTGREIMTEALATAKQQGLSGLHYGQMQGECWVQRRDTSLPPPDWLWPVAGKPASAEEESCAASSVTVAKPELLVAAVRGDGGRTGTCGPRGKGGQEIK